MAAPEVCQKTGTNETHIALKYIVDVWLSGELGNFREFLSVVKKRKKSFASNK